jgi:hypothetical protein
MSIPPPATARRLAHGLWRWTAPHPAWVADAEPDSPGDWEQMVGSVLYELEQVAVLIDPLLPSSNRDGFRAWLDDHVGGRPVSILTTIRWHRRDREKLAERYRAQTRQPWNAVPRGVVPYSLRGAGERLYWLPGAAALVAGDRLLGAADGRLRVCPESWLRRERTDRRGVATLLRGLLELPIELVVPSHGEPVTRGGGAALARAIADVLGDAALG